MTDIETTQKKKTTTAQKILAALMRTVPELVKPVSTTRNGSYTKKGPGRYHMQG